MTRRSAAQLDLLSRRLGRDLALEFPGPSGYWEDADLGPARRGHPVRYDVGVVDGMRAAEQMLINRLKTHRGELAALGHPDYGSRHHELVGQPNVARTRDLVKLHVLDALRREPRIREVTRCEVRAESAPPREVVRIDIDLVLIEEDTPLNLVVPFSLSGVATGEAS
jgi:phage baseplate assembly protein W